MRGKHTKDINGSSEATKPHKKSKLHTAKRVVLFTLLGLLVIGGVLVGKYFYDINHPAELFGRPTATPAPLQTPSITASAAPTATANVASTPSPSPTPGEEAILLSQADLEFMKNRVNILVLGIDESTERANWGSFRTDTMIIITINFDTNDVDMISIPRDSYVKICNASAKPTGGFGKINSAFPSGGGAKKSGFEYAMGTVSYLFGGIPIDYYIGFNMNVVKEVVNAMGGVDYDVDVEIRMNGRQLHPGMQHLDGQAVLDYCRQRKDSSDFVRIERQQRMLQAIFAQLKSTGQIVNIPKIYTAVEQNIQTNLSFTQISALALLALNMDRSQLGSHTVPGQSLMVNKSSCVALSSTKIQSMVQEVFGIKVSIDQDINFASIKARIEEQRALIATELNAAQSAINTASNILNTYALQLLEGEKNQLSSAMGKLQEAVDDGDKASLDVYTPQLVQWNNYVLSQLRARGVQTGNNPQPTPAQPTPAQPTPSSAEPSESPGVKVPPEPKVPPKVPVG